MLEADIDRGIAPGLKELQIALRESRARLGTMLAGLEDEDWLHPSRCELWSVHDVARHVLDVARIHVARLRGDPPPFPSEQMLDGRTEPLRWLRHTAGDSPDRTLHDLNVLASAEVDAFIARAEQNDDRKEQGPYGPVHWTILTMHVFWDAWIHERDITQALRRPHLATPTEDGAAALYGLLVASIPATLAGETLEAVVQLTAPSGSEWIVQLAPRHAALGPPGSDDHPDLTGDLLDVLDALAGRGPEPETVLNGDSVKLGPLTWLRAFMVPPS